MVLPMGLLLVSASAAPAAPAVEVTDLAERRTRLAEERRRVIAESQAQERRCHEQFVVTPCIEDVRQRRRERLDGLNREQAVIDGAMRQQRAAERLQRLADKQRAQRAALAASAPPPRVLQRQAPVAAAASAAEGRAAAADRPAAKPATGAPGDARRERTQYEQRLREAQRHREEVLQRNARRAAEGRPAAAPLPLPAASDLAR